MAAELPANYWATDTATLMAQLATTPQGLAKREAARRLKSHGPNSVGDDSRVRREGSRLVLSAPGGARFEFAEAK